MKTRTYLSALLALTIQVMVNGQTQGNQASQSRPENKLGVILKHHNLNISKKQTVIGDQTIVQNVITQDNVAVNTIPTANTSAQTLNQQANDLVLKSQTLREAAQNTTGLVKSELLAEASELYKQAEILLITELELSGQKNSETFSLNKLNINQLLVITNISAVAGKEAQNLISDANMNMRIAGEMRQEAYAMPTNAAKLGSMSNADEKEILAIGEQNQAIHILKSYAANAAAGIDFNSYAAK